MAARNNRSEILIQCDEEGCKGGTGFSVYDYYHHTISKLPKGFKKQVEEYQCSCGAMFPDLMEVGRHSLYMKKKKDPRRHEFDRNVAFDINENIEGIEAMVKTFSRNLKDKAVIPQHDGYTNSPPRPSTTNMQIQSASQAPTSMNNRSSPGAETPADRKSRNESQPNHKKSSKPANGDREAPAPKKKQPFILKPFWAHKTHQKPPRQQAEAEGPRERAVAAQDEDNGATRNLDDKEAIRPRAAEENPTHRRNGTGNDSEDRNSRQQPGSPVRDGHDGLHDGGSFVGIDSAISASQNFSGHGSASADVDLYDDPKRGRIQTMRATASTSRRDSAKGDDNWTPSSSLTSQAAQHLPRGHQEPQRKRGRRPRQTPSSSRRLRQSPSRDDEYRCSGGYNPADFPLRDEDGVYAHTRSRSRSRSMLREETPPNYDEDKDDDFWEDFDRVYGRY